MQQFFLRQGGLRRNLLFVREKGGYHPKNAEQLAEAYCMGALALPEEIAFEDHYIACARCAEIVENTALYVGAMQVAARRLREFVRGVERVETAVD